MTTDEKPQINPIVEKPQRPRNDGPNFLHKLLGKNIVISLVDGTDMEESIMKGYNRYEVLIENQNGDHVLILKHAILSIHPVSYIAGNDPFKVVPKEEE
jgi:sRNA-binding regulator protein Hfq